MIPGWFIAYLLLKDTNVGIEFKNPIPSQPAISVRKPRKAPFKLRMKMKWWNWRNKNSGLTQGVMHVEELECISRRATYIGSDGHYYK